MLLAVCPRKALYDLVLPNRTQQQPGPGRRLRQAEQLPWGHCAQLEKDAISAQSWLSVGKNLCSKHLFRCASDIATHCPPCPPRAIKTTSAAGNPTRRSIVESRIKDSPASSGRDRVGMGGFVGGVSYA